LLREHLAPAYPHDSRSGSSVSASADVVIG